MVYPISGKFQQSLVACMVAYLFSPPLAFAGGSCNVQGGISTIGLEYVSDMCPTSDDDEIYYTVDPFSCQNGAVKPYSIYGSMGLTPRSLKEAAKNGQPYRVYFNEKGTHVILVHQNYQGTLSLSDGQMHSPTLPLSADPRCQQPPIQLPDVPGQEPGCNKTNPIDPAWRGNKSQPQLDFVAEGAFPLSFTRHYNSRKVHLPIETVPLAIRSSIGSFIPKSFAKSGGQPSPAVGDYMVGSSGEIQMGAADSYGIAGEWTNTYSMRMVQLDSGLTRIAITRPNGQAIMFGKLSGVWQPVTFANGTMTAAPKVAERLDVVTDGVTISQWRLTNAANQIEEYDATGKLTTIIHPSGLRHVLTYNGSGQLLSVTHSNGSKLQFAFNAIGQLTTLTLPDLQTLTYNYDNYGNLTKITYPDATPGITTDNPYRSYLYERAQSPRALTGISDSGVRYATWTYDTQGRATSSAHAGGVDLHTVTYLSDDKATITSPLNADTTYNYATVQNRRVVSSVSQPAGSGCSASASAFTYDASGNIASQTDFNGNTTTYSYDTARVLEISRTEASGKPQARTITTVWHPTFRLPTKITEPGRVTEYTYDTRANVTLKKVTDTTQATPVVRSTTYTYVYNADANNPYIQKLTVDGPRADASDIVVYDYDTSGRLKTVTQQTSANTTLITNYGGYDANGRVGTITAPNGVVTQLTYHPRGWLKTRVIGFGSATPLTTTFEYDPVGQLIKVTLPDNSFVRYTYDAAHRLTDIVDASGNRIHYTLDNAGNRIKEEVTDASGVLAALLLQIQTVQADAQLPHAGEAI